MLSIDAFLRLVDAYCAASGLAVSTLSTRLFNDGKRISTLRAGRDIGARRMEAALAKLSSLWPSDLGWPADIPRPHTPARVSSTPPQPSDAAPPVSEGATLERVTA
ncbi:hypothetical protein [Kaistia geumhonensis]|nr:hypothetical protein [Kaistia geumhonensis]